MGMGETGGDLDLAEKPLGPEGGGQLGTEHLHRDGAAVFQVLGRIDRRRAPAAELPLDCVTVGKGGAQAREQLSQERRSGVARLHHTAAWGKLNIEQLTVNPLHSSGITPGKGGCHAHTRAVLDARGRRVRTSDH